LINHEGYDIVIVEDNANDAEIMVHCLKRNYLANNLISLKDGAQALDFIFCREKIFRTKFTPAGKSIFFRSQPPQSERFVRI